VNVVYDIGCCHWGTETSIDKLVQRFSPDRLLGFDPQARPMSYRLDDTKVVVEQRAAWTHPRGVYLHASRSGCWVGDERGERRAKMPSFDLAEEILSEPAPVVVKLDVEGGEYVLIPHLIATGAISNVSLLLVEWHGEPLEGVEWDPWHD